MSCNGCRILRKGCGVDCVLRPCLDWIESPDAQAHATLFVSKFFGRGDLVSYISSVSYDHQRAAMFRSLLYEAAGRTVNPVTGAMGLLSTGNWHLCEAAVQTVLAGGSPTAEQNLIQEVNESSDDFQSRAEWGVMMIRNQADSNDQKLPFMPLPEADVALDLTIGYRRNDGEEPKLLNLFQ
ncbi:putative transcription factor AS2-LOB family [Helianthus debilis subsp. tardiflorus]